MIEYECYIKGEFCNVKCNDKKVYLVTKNMTRKSEAEYLGNGSAKTEDHVTGYPIIVWEKSYTNKQITCNFACSNCAKYICNNCYLQDVLNPEESDYVILNSKSNYLWLEVQDLVEKRDKLTKLIKNKRKEIDKILKQID